MSKHTDTKQMSTSQGSETLDRPIDASHEMKSSIGRQYTETFDTDSMDSLGSLAFHSSATRLDCPADAIHEVNASNGLPNSREETAACRKPGEEPEAGQMNAKTFGNDSMDALESEVSSSSAMSLDCPLDITRHQGKALTGNQTKRRRLRRGQQPSALPNADDDLLLGAPGPGSYNLMKDGFDCKSDSHTLMHTTPATFPRQGREWVSAEERRQFKRADQNGDGKLDIQEVKSLLQQGALKVDDKQASALFSSMDINRDGIVDFEELVAYTHSLSAAEQRHRKLLKDALATSASPFRGRGSLLNSQAPGPGSYDLMKDGFEGQSIRSSYATLPRRGRDRVTAEERRQFRLADMNGDGKLDLGEIKSLLQRGSFKVEDKEAESLLDAMDINHDGRVDMDELVSYTHSPSTVDQSRRNKLRDALATPIGFNRRQRGLLSSKDPGPGTYNLMKDGFDRRSAHGFDSGPNRSKSAVVFARHGRSDITAEERRQFRSADLNGDGKLDHVEVRALLQRSSPSMKDEDASRIFHSADRNLDGSIDLQELVDYTRSTLPSERHRRDQMRLSLARSVATICLRPTGHMNKRSKALA